MVVLIVLLAVFGLVVAIQAIRRQSINSRVAGCIALAAMFLFTGTSHFGLADDMVLMLPDWVPWRYPIIYITGVMELAMGVGLLWKLAQRFTGVVAILFLLCVFPANIYAALNSVEFGGNVHGPRYLLFRVPLQIFLIGWIWFAAVRPRRSLRSVHADTQANH